MNYHSFNISPLCSDVEFIDLLNYASNSTNKHVSNLADNIKNYGKGSEEAKLVAQR
jgi:hypothetical protein